MRKEIFESIEQTQKIKIVTPLKISVHQVLEGRSLVWPAEGRRRQCGAHHPLQGNP